MTAPPESDAAADREGSISYLMKPKDSAQEISTIPAVEEVGVPPDFPDGGLQAWLTVLGGWMVVFCSLGTLMSFGVYQDYYTRISLNEHTPSEISWIGSVQTAFLFLTGLPAGKLYDEGHFHALVVFGSLLWLFSTFMLSLVQPHHYYQNFLAQGLGLGIAMGLLSLPAVSVVSHYFRRRRSYAMGVVFAGEQLFHFIIIEILKRDIYAITGSGVGGVIYPIMLNKLFNGKAGFAWGVRAAGFLDVFLLVTANFLMKTRLPTRKKLGNKKTATFANMRGDAGYWLFLSGCVLIEWGVYFPYFYLQLFAILHGVPASLADYTIPLMNATSIIGRTIPNILADRWGPLNVIIPGAIVSGAMIFVMFAASSSAGMIVFALLYGVSSGTFLGLITPLAASFSVDNSEVGIRIGVMMFTSAPFLLTSNPIAGALLSPPHYLWWRPIIFVSVVIFFGSFLLAVSRSFTIKRKGSWRV